MSSALLTVLTYVAPFLFVLTLVVTVHELGHFLVARALGVAVDRFSIGFGRPLLRWRDPGGVEWRLGWIPVGGYVGFTGEDDAPGFGPPTQDRLEAMRRNAGTKPRHFHLKPVWERALVVAAGPASNFLLSILLFAALAMAVGSASIAPRVGVVTPKSPAEIAGFRAGDLIVSMDGRPVDDFSDVAQYVQLRAAQPIRFDVRRAAAGQSPATVRLVATPERRRMADPLTGATTQMGVLGLQSSGSPQDIHRRRYGPVQAVGFGVQRTADVLSTTVFYLGRVARGLESGDQLGGPVRIAQVSGALAKAEAHAGPTLAAKIEGAFGALLSLAAVLSVGIGFLNLMPVPVLDGGHLLFYAYEALARRPVGPRVQALGFRVGLVLLLGLTLFTTWNDLQQLRLFKMLGGLFS